MCLHSRWKKAFCVGFILFLVYFSSFILRDLMNMLSELKRLHLKLLHGVIRRQIGSRQQSFLTILNLFTVIQNLQKGE